MVESEFVYDVTVESFQQRVLEKSHEVPVLVDFWAGWCQPCQMLLPILAGLAEEFQGKFLLAKVNTDEQQDLALQFSVRSLPTVKFFRDGQVVEEFMGVQPATAIRELLDRHVTRESDRVRGEARTLLEAAKPGEAVELLRGAAEMDPDNPRVATDLAEALVASGELDEAEQMLGMLSFLKRQEEPATRLYAKIRFRRQARDADGSDTEALKMRVADAPDDLDSRTQLAAQLVIGGQLEAAMDQYLEIMRRDRDYQEEAGRKGLIGIFDLLGDDDPRVNTYRRRMFAMMH